MLVRLLCFAAFTKLVCRWHSQILCGNHCMSLRIACMAANPRQRLQQTSCVKSTLVPSVRVSALPSPCQATLLPHPKYPRSEVLQNHLICMKLSTYVGPQHRQMKTLYLPILPEHVQHFAKCVPSSAGTQYPSCYLSSICTYNMHNCNWFPSVTACQ